MIIPSFIQVIDRQLLSTKVIGPLSAPTPYIMDSPSARFWIMNNLKYAIGIMYNNMSEIDRLAVIEIQNEYIKENTSGYWARLESGYQNIFAFELEDEALMFKLRFA